MSMCLRGLGLYRGAMSRGRFLQPLKNGKSFSVVSSPSVGAYLAKQVSIGNLPPFHKLYSSGDIRGWMIFREYFDTPNFALQIN